MVDDFDSLLLDSSSPLPLTFALRRSAPSLAGANAARAFPAAAAFCAGVASGSNAWLSAGILVTQDVDG